MGTQPPAGAQGMPLLHTKFYIPPLRREQVPRPRLIERLNAGLGRKLTLVSAPAGFGKTTLLSEWIAGCDRPSAWLSLDAEDSDLTRFLAYLVGALQMIPDLSEAGIGESMLAMLHAAQSQPPPVEVILTTLINEILTIPAAFILVLDDYHLIQAQPIHDALIFLLDHLPPSMHLALATRADPPLPIARLRGLGQLTELRQTDLRFAREEAVGFLNQAMGLSLSAEDIAALDSRTEGWIVGLQLAALSLQDRSDTHEFITAFTGEHHYVLEYLIEEVVCRQPKPVQRFLMQTSILDRLCGSLCDALTDESDGEAMLARLRRRNLFILALDDEHHWYRYHHLFADLLKNLLRKDEPPERIRELHLRARAWHQRNGQTAEAVHHALAAKDFQWMARLIEDNSLTMISRGGMTMLLRWIAALPESVARSRPWLCIHQAWPLTLAGRADAAAPLLHQIEQQVAIEDLSAERQEILGHVAAMRAMTAMMRGDMRQATELAHRAGELLPSDNVIPRNTTLYTLASAYYAEGELWKAEQALAEVLELGRAAGNAWMVVRTLCDLADLEMLRGQLGRAVDLCHEALQQAEERRARQFGTGGYVLVQLGEICYERDDLLAARNHVSEGVELMQGWERPYEMARGYTTLATILQAQNDAPGAREALRHAEALRSQHPNYHKLNSMVDGCRIRLCLAEKGPDEAARLATGMQLGQAGALIFREQEQILLAKVLLAQQKLHEALRLLAHLEQKAKPGGRSGRLIAILVLQALALQAHGEVPQALVALEKALALGETEGYVRVFVDGGAPMADLLRQAAVRGIAPQYVRALLEALGEEKVETVTAPLPSSAPPLVERLTPRELEVLHLLGEGCSNREIAQALVITLNGVKKHTSNIYGKLGVHNRTQAVVLAQEMGLL